MSQTAVIIIPVYNESATIGAMIECLTLQVFKQTAWQCLILVVDGNSPDGTADIVREAQRRHPEVHLLVEEKKEGLGAAYFKGFDYAVRRIGADVLIEFDGDFQHPPEAIPLLLAEIDRGADLVLGSRKRPGGSYPAHWDRLRLFFSRFGGFVARIILFFPHRSFRQVTDPTTGLKATRVGENYHALDFPAFSTKGFGYKLEMLFKLVQGGAIVAEIPLQFQTRRAGESKMTGQTPLDILSTVLRLRWQAEATQRFIKFALIGFAGYLVNAGLLEVFARSPFLASLLQHHPGLGRLPGGAFLAHPSGWAAALATEGAIIHNFVWNHFWTFSGRSAGRMGDFARKFLSFNMCSFGSVLIQFCAMALATHVLGDTMAIRQITLILTIGLLVVPLNWFIYNVVIWKHRAC